MDKHPIDSPAIPADRAHPALTLFDTERERIADSLEVDEENAQGSYVVGLAEIIDRKAVPR